MKHRITDKNSRSSCVSVDSGARGYKIILEPYSQGSESTAVKIILLVVEVGLNVFDRILHGSI